MNQSFENQDEPEATECGYSHTIINHTYDIGRHLQGVIVVGMFGLGLFAIIYLLAKINYGV